MQYLRRFERHANLLNFSDEEKGEVLLEKLPAVSSERAAAENTLGKGKCSYDLMREKLKLHFDFRALKSTLRADFTSAKQGGPKR